MTDDEPEALRRRSLRVGSNPVLQAAYREGWNEQAVGVDRACPYSDRRKAHTSGVTWSRGRIHAWLAGWDDRAFLAERGSR